jgi:hypothetical protein
MTGQHTGLGSYLGNTQLAQNTILPKFPALPKHLLEFGMILEFIYLPCAHFNLTATQP